MNTHPSAAAVKYSQLSLPSAGLLPDNSCDCHHHIFDRRYPWAPGDTRNLPDATLSDYLHFQRWLGFTRHVLVQPSSYGTDNRCLTDALLQAGHNARGVAVVTDKISDGELDRLDAAGVTGVRFNFGAGNATTPAMLLPVAQRLAERGWHVQVHATADTLLQLKPLLLQLPGNLVIDHCFRLPQPAPAAHPTWQLARQLIDGGRCWVKLSGLYHQSQRDDVRDMAGLIQTLLRDAPERVLWGSDWPHPSLITENKKMPDDALILSTLFHWAANKKIRQKLFVDNPAELYRF